VQALSASRNCSCVARKQFDSKLVENNLGRTMDLANGDMASLLQLAVASTGALGIDNAPSLIGRIPLTGFSITWSKIGVGDLKPVNGAKKYSPRPCWCTRRPGTNGILSWSGRT